MASSSNNGHSRLDMVSINKIPFFNEIFFTYWKERMTLYMQSFDLKMLRLIKKGYEFPTNIVNGRHVLKDLDDYTEEEEKWFIQNSKSILFLVHAMDINEYNKNRRVYNEKEY